MGAQQPLVLQSSGRDVVSSSRFKLGANSGRPNSNLPETANCVQLIFPSLFLLRHKESLPIIKHRSLAATLTSCSIKNSAPCTFIVIRHFCAVGDYPGSSLKLTAGAPVDLRSQASSLIQPPLNFPGMLDTNHLLGPCFHYEHLICTFLHHEPCRVPMNRD